MKPKTKELFLKVIDRVGAALLIAVCGFGANQVKFLYESVQDLNQNLAVIGTVIKGQGEELKTLDERVRYLERGRR